ncbi:NUDIX hydrolase [Microbaculum marinum]|uniref:GDP-mannose pyrophosphatase n=1 Tax=Microbaculum marinum TaxID=1764581 RepID=A0AAW9RYD0_9HYPH
MKKADPPPRIVREETLSDGFVRLDHLLVEAPWGGGTVRLDREVHFHGHGAAVLPVDPARAAGILIRQFRVPAFLDDGDGWLWEVPAGLLDGDSPEQCALKEAREETGVAVESLESLGDSLSSPGVMRERIHLFWGTYSVPPSSATGGLDHEGEMIEVHELPLVEIARMAVDGEIVDSKSAMIVFRLMARRPDLFGRKAAAADVT